MDRCGSVMGVGVSWRPLNLRAFMDETCVHVSSIVSNIRPPACVRAGLSNIRPPTYVTTTAAAEDSSAALTFVDGTPTSLFWNNIRTAPLSSYGWPYYGKASQSAVQSGEKYATCSMVCLTPSTDPGPSNPTQVTVRLLMILGMDSCTSFIHNKISEKKLWIIK